MNEASAATAATARTCPGVVDRAARARAIQGVAGRALGPSSVGSPGRAPHCGVTRLVGHPTWAADIPVARPATTAAAVGKQQGVTPRDDHGCIEHDHPARPTTAASSPVQSSPLPARARRVDRAAQVDRLRRDQCDGTSSCPIRGRCIAAGGDEKHVRTSEPTQDAPPSGATAPPSGSNPILPQPMIPKTAIPRTRSMYRTRLSSSRDVSKWFRSGVIRPPSTNILHI
jgi:hypothetical protein